MSGDRDNDGIDWAEVSWMDRDLSEGRPCCDSRDHNDDDAVCLCPNHPNSYLHPAGSREWPEP